MLVQLNNLAALFIDAPPSFQFIVPGRLVPAPRMTARSKWTRGKKYMEYRKKLQMYAVQAGIRLPLEGRWFIFVEAYFENKKTADPDNLYKSVTDGLFKQDKSVNGYVKINVDRNIEPFCGIYLFKLKEDAGNG